MNEQQILEFSNHDLIQSLEKLFIQDRRTNHFILVHLKEIQARKLYADMGFSDLFKMLVIYFKQSATAANQRLQALKLMEDVPEIKIHLISGDLNLTTLAMTQRQINREEKITGTKIDAAKKSEIIEQITCKTTDEAEKELMRLLPKSSETLETKERRISATETRLSLTIPDRVKQKMKRLKDHWAAVNPRMDYLELIERAFDIAWAKEDPTRKMKRSSTETVSQDSKRPVKRKTYYSRATDQVLWEKANSQCEYMDSISGRRCISTFGLERDHIIPLAKGGSNEVSNLRLLCRTHNQMMARRHFGSKPIQLTSRQ